MRNVIREGYAIKVILPEECGYKGYSVRCLYKYSKDNGKYYLSMWLNRNDIDNDFKIDSQEIGAEYVYGKRETIENKISKTILDASLAGYFEKYIHQFEYWAKCCDIGNEILEAERLAETNGKE